MGSLEIKAQGQSQGHVISAFMWFVFKADTLKI